MEVWTIMVWKNILEYMFYNIFDMFFLIYFMGEIYETKKEIKKSLNIIAFLIIIFTTLSMQPHNNYFNLEAITIMSFLLLGFFKCDVRKKLLFSIIIIVIAGFWSSVIYILFRIIHIPNTTVDFFINFFGNIGFGIIILGVTRLLKNQHGTVELKLYILLLSIPVVSILAYFSIMYLLSMLPIKKVNILFFI